MVVDEEKGLPPYEFVSSERKSQKKNLKLLASALVVVLFLFYYCNCYFFDVFSNHRVVVGDFYKPADGGSVYLKPIAPYGIPSSNFSLWIENESQRALDLLLRNVADRDLLGNSLTQSDPTVPDGAIIGSPSRSRPDYYYQWIRDGAIVINTVIDACFSRQDLNATLAGTIVKYMNNTYNLQRSFSRSGNGIDGLGEPIWNVDGSSFDDDWGRPQNDGPAVRVLAFCKFVHNLHSVGLTIKDVVGDYQVPFQNEQELYDRIISWDLRFIASHWDQDSFDLWEEVYGKHFYTMIVQLSALKHALLCFGSYMSADMVIKLRQVATDLEKTIMDTKTGFIQDGYTHLIETPANLQQRSGLDIGIILGSLYSHMCECCSKHVPFNINDSRVLGTLQALTKEMRSIYPVNKQHAHGIALGRYPEDVYNGYGVSEGNPWFISTLSAAELTYKLVSYTQREDLHVLLDGTSFWSNLLEWPQQTTCLFVVVPKDSKAMKQLQLSLYKLAESYMDVVRQHTSMQGHMSEQFNKYTGYMQGASDLTWSYSAFLDAYRARTHARQLL